jgi:two-component system phosphate regulon sensor histidine kinase PhoR
MKKRDTILLPGIVSIIILMIAQIIIVSGVWRQKDEMFNLRYRLYTQDALEYMGRRWGTDGFDTARILINSYSAKAARELAEIKNDSLLNTKKKDVLIFVSKVLTQEQDLSEFLSDYFERQGIEKDFNYNIKINYLELIYNDIRIPIFVNRDQSGAVSRKTDIRYRPFGFSGTSQILVKGDRSESNNFRLDFEYYIDIRDKQRLVLRETFLPLALSIFSILAVVALFMITYRNLMTEKRLSNLKTDFINNMTHELKTPLSTITVAGKTLEMPQVKNDEKKVLETAKIIGKQSVHLNQLINMILEISMWERTQFELEKKKFRLEDVIREIVVCFKNGSGRCASIRESYDFKPPDVELDLVYFTTMINNLLSNAVKYSDGNPEIEIRGYSESNKAVIRISDNGIGISRNDQKHIFDKFYRAASGNIHKYKGLGLGLYYVKKIAEAHGGDVSVISKTGKGSTFIVAIPY